MKKSNRLKSDKEKDKERLMLLTSVNIGQENKGGAKSFSGYSYRYVLGIYYEINITYKQITRVLPSWSVL